MPKKNKSNPVQSNTKLYKTAELTSASEQMQHSRCFASHAMFSDIFTTIKQTFHTTENEHHTFESFLTMTDLTSRFTNCQTNRT